jgi:hypothetical protein
MSLIWIRVLIETQRAITGGRVLLLFTPIVNLITGRLRRLQFGSKIYANVKAFPLIERKAVT